jgi:hypothetical protein
VLVSDARVLPRLWHLLDGLPVCGVLPPLLVVRTQIHYGWRASFYFFGLFGVA